jgi:DNA-binding response OmpR family regulator
LVFWLQAVKIPITRRGKMAKEKIVVIDDSPIVRKLAELALEEEGYKVYTAEDGEEGLRVSEEVLPSVILVDFIMPRISGYQFCKSARENELLKDIPIILITGKGEDVGKKFAEKFGVVDYFIKPFKSEMLVDKVNSIINAQRQQADEEMPFLETPQDQVETEEPAYQFGASVEALTVELAEVTEAREMAELNEVSETADEFAGVFKVPDTPEEVLPGEKEVEVSPVFSFDDISTLEEPQPFFQTETEEIGSGISSFDFNLEELSTQQIVAEGEEMLAIPPVAETPDGMAGIFDFESMQELNEMDVADDEIQSVSIPIAETEKTMDRIFRRYLSDELPLLIEKRVEDVLKRHGVIKPTEILFSGSLSEISGVEMLKLASSSRLTGKFFAFSSAGSAEIYFDEGLVAYAVTSRHNRPAASKPGLSDESVEGLNVLMSEALLMVADLRDGRVFFERMELPSALLGVPRRMNVTALLLDGSRRHKGDIEEISSGSIFSKQIGDPVDCGLNDEELGIFTFVDGIRTAGDIAGLSGLGLSLAQGILSRLVKAGVLSHKGGF